MTDRALAETRAWVDLAVIGLNLCPFAKAPQTKGQVRYALSEARDPEALLLPDLLTSEADWDLSLHLKYSSHRPAAGGLIIWVKRRVLLPLMRWLYEYSLENFRRQRRINTVLFACIEELAIENARLRQALHGDSSRAGFVEASSDSSSGRRSS